MLVVELLEEGVVAALGLGEGPGGPLHVLAEALDRGGLAHVVAEVVVVEVVAGVDLDLDGGRHLIALDAGEELGGGPLLGGRTGGGDGQGQEGGEQGGAAHGVWTGQSSPSPARARRHGPRRTRGCAQRWQIPAGFTWTAT